MEKKPDFKAMSARTKVEYVWDYYKWHIIGAVTAAAALFSTVRHFVTYQEPALSVIMINSSSMDTDGDGFDEFLEAYGHNPEEEWIALSTNIFFSEDSAAESVTSIQLLAAMVAAGDQDLFFGAGDIYLDYADQGALTDLSEVLPSDILEQYKSSLIYTTEDGSTEAYPCAIELTQNAWLSENHYYDTCYFGIFYNAPHMETAREFAEFLLTSRS